MTKATAVEYKAIRTILQEKQIKQTLSHNKSKRPFKVDENFVLSNNDTWKEWFVTGTRDCGRSYNIPNNNNYYYLLLYITLQYCTVENY